MKRRERSAGTARFGRCCTYLIGCALLAGGCGSGHAAMDHSGTPSATATHQPVPQVSPGALSLRAAWHLKPRGQATEVTVGDALVVVTPDPQHANERVLTFVDAATGRIRTRVRHAPRGTTRVTTDRHGRPTLVLDIGGKALSGPHRERVYDTNGKLVWRSHAAGVRYIGGYRVTGHGGQDPVVLSDLHGHVLLRLRARLLNIPEGYGAQHGPIVAVRPGRLALADEQDVRLVDLRGHHPHTTTVVPPRGYHKGAETIMLTASGGKIYVPWQHGGTVEVAAYDVSGGRPTRHSTPFRGALSGLTATTGADHHTAVLLNSAGVRLLNGDTGKWLVPWHRYGSDLAGVYGGLAFVPGYSQTDDRSFPAALDIKTGKTVATMGTAPPYGWHLVSVTAHGIAIFTAPDQSIIGYRLSRQ